MEFEELSTLILGELTSKMGSNSGLSIFASNRSQFEDWLKVELCGSLSKYFQDVAPERNRIDVTFDDWAIELKTVSTSYRYDKVIDKEPGAITDSVTGIIKDAEKLMSTNYANKAVLFVVFPVTLGKPWWQYHLNRISPSLREMKSQEFRFENEVPAIIYFGLV